MGAKPRKPPSTLVWHFLPADRKLRYGDGRVVVPGEVLSVPDLERPLELCVYGMHASIDPMHALGYAPGPVVCRVALSGRLLTGDDKLCAQHRRVIWMSDATQVLRKFARLCALDVIDQWDAPYEVRQYLETGDESKRSAAWYAAWYAARYAVRSAADYVVRSAADYAARSAADSAADSAAEYAAEYAAYAAQSAAEYAAYAAQPAAQSAAGYAAEYAAYAAYADPAAARSAARSAQSHRLATMLLELRL